LHDSPTRYVSRKEKYLNPFVRGTSWEKPLEFARSHKSSIKRECKRSVCSAVRCFAVKVTAFRKQKLLDYVQSSSYPFFTFL